MAFESTLFLIRPFLVLLEGESVTITRVGTNDKYSSGWEGIFGSSKSAKKVAKASATPTATAKKAVKKSAAKAAPKKSAKKVAKKAAKKK
jgi:hypothetical protein